MNQQSMHKRRQFVKVGKAESTTTGLQEEKNI